MVLVESSVFIQVQRLPSSNEAIELGALLTSGEAAVTGPVIMEYLRGARSMEELEFLSERILSVDCLEMDPATWVVAGRLSNHLRRSGEVMTDLDVAIAATAIRHNVPLYTLDSDFDRIPELVLYQPTQGR
ncbi:MAG: PIN domain-containing protein [Chloroflexi bacterium]|nr:PIN domain-containing protein [Chloroflexota bacterium]